MIDYDDYDLGLAPVACRACENILTEKERHEGEYCFDCEVEAQQEQDVFENKEV